MLNRRRWSSRSIASVVCLLVLSGGAFAQSAADEDGVTLGVNFRPTEETVFKLDYNWRRMAPAQGDKGDAEGRLFFSFATYF